MKSYNILLHQSHEFRRKNENAVHGKRINALWDDNTILSSAMLSELYPVINKVNYTVYYNVLEKY